MDNIKTPPARVIATQKYVKLNGWTCEIGTMDKANPIASFIKVSGYCNPGANNINDIMTSFQYKVERHITNVTIELLGKHLPKNFIPIKIIEWSDTLPHKQFNKWSYFAIEVTNYHYGLRWSDSSFQDDLKLILYSIIDYLEEYEDGIHFNKKRP